MIEVLAQVEFPPIDNIVNWEPYFGEDQFFQFDKVSLIMLLAVLIPAGLFMGAKKSMIPSGLQTVTEGSVNFINGIVDQTIGHDGKKYLPLLMSMFWFIFIGNITEVIPSFQMPVNARMGAPVVLALLVFFFSIGVGLKHHGLTYFKNTLIVPGLPPALHLLVVPIEFLSNFFIKPFSHAVRLFANMLAGHILLVTFGVLCIALFSPSLLALALPFSFAMLVGLTGFEIMVAFLQAYIFTLLAGVYIGSALHPDH